MNYWARRLEEEQTAIADRTIEDIQKRLKKYYNIAARKVIEDFEKTYNKVLAAKEDDREPTPADLYKLDQYWQMQAQLKKELQALGDKEIKLLSKEFEDEWRDIYKTVHLPSDKAFSTISTANAKQMVNSPWLQDGKSFSQRVWNNTEKLVETLNDELMNCVITGKKPSELTKKLQERFDVSYSQANTLVKTEVAHIQTQSAAQRYKDYGLERYEFLGRDEHDIGCACKKLDGKIFAFKDMRVGVNAPPMHPNCRCAIAPVVDKEMEKDIMENKIYTNTCKQCGKKFNTDMEYVKVCPDCQKQMREDRLMWYKELGMPSENIRRLREAWDNDTEAELIMYKRKCSVCGKITESPYKHGTAYCSEACQNRAIEQYEFNKNYEWAWCSDCGELFKRKKTAKNQKRCPECQAEYRRKYKAEKEKERRDKKKQTK